MFTSEIAEDTYGNTVVTIYRNGSIWNRATIVQYSAQSFTVFYGEDTNRLQQTYRSRSTAISRAIQEMTR